MNPQLILTFDSGQFGDQFTMVINLSEEVAMDCMTPAVERPLFPTRGGFDQMVKLLRKKQFRKDLFIRECKRLGTLLAERMEDAEGWHDESRVEPAKKQLRQCVT